MVYIISGMFYSFTFTSFGLKAMGMTNTYIHTHRYDNVVVRYASAYLRKCMMMDRIS